MKVKTALLTVNSNVVSELRFKDKDLRLEDLGSEDKDLRLKDLGSEDKDKDL